MASSTVQNRVERNTDDSMNRRRDQSDCQPQLSVLNDFQCYAREYVQQKPETAALICLGVGFILGWKLKPW